MVWGRFVMASVDATRGNFNWENLPPKGYPLALLRSRDIKGEALAWFRKQIWPTLGK